MDLNLRHARAFVSVAHHGSFTKAASALHLSQPALTVQIRNFETALKLKLLDRNSRSVELTRTGRELLPILERTLRELDVIVADTHAVSAGHRGTVRIAALPSFAAGVLPKVIRALCQAEPGLRFVVRDAVASRVIELVDAEEVDVGLTAGDVPADRFEVLCLSEDRLYVVFPPDHAFARLARVRVEDLIGVPLVLTDHSTSVRAIVERAFSMAQLRPLIACETTHMLTAAAMVAGGLGVAILPGQVCDSEAMPNLSARPMGSDAFVRPIALVKKLGRTLSAACESFALACIAAIECDALARKESSGRKFRS